jgi:Tol biopolymer transport system component
MTSGRVPQFAAAAALLVAGGLAFWSLSSQKVSPPSAGEETKNVTGAPATAPDALVVRRSETTSPERMLGEIRYLPSNVQLERNENRLVPPGFTLGARLLVNAKTVTDKARDGDFISPRWSPDGMSILLSRPGFSGIYILDPATGEIRKIADDNGYRAGWTADGRIAIPGESGLTYLNTDGSVAEGGANFPSSLAWAENDAVYVAGPDRQPRPVTGTEDKYFNPVTSPDGRYVVYQGLVSGLYIVPTDGSRPPRWIGRGGNPSWMPDSSGVVFDRTTDDGHHLNSGDLLLLDLRNNEISNLTMTDSGINQMPQVSPSGRQIVYETEGQVIVGSLQ